MSAVLLILRLLLDEVIDTVEGNSSVVTYDTSASVCITGNLHLIRISIKYCLIVSLVILIEDLVVLVIYMIAVLLCSFLSHLDATIRHECPLKRFVCLKTYDLLKILHALIDIAGTVSCKR